MNHPRILRPSFTRQDERGTLRELLNHGRWHSLVQGEMKAGAVMGNHYHKETVVFFFLITGRASIKLRHLHTGRTDALILEAMEGIIFETYETHAVTFEEDGMYLLLRSIPYDPQNPDTFKEPV